MLVRKSQRVSGKAGGKHYRFLKMDIPHHLYYT